MQAVFYSNIMFYENLNNTLPEGMDISREVLLDLSKYETKLIRRKDFYMSFITSEFDRNIKLIQVYEYDLEKRKD